MNDPDPHGPNPAATSAPDTRHRVPLASGTLLDHYVIQSVLGSGGFGITYLANHDLLGKYYAIKEYFPHEFSYREGYSVRPTTTSGPTYRWGLDRFLSEARALARFKHPAIVDVVSVFEANETAYIVLAYEKGRDMVGWHKALGRAPTQAEFDRVLAPLLDALEEVHSRNLLHRDIAPDNVLVRDDGTPVLIDFGSARESVRGRSKVLSAIVKRGYSPPEQYSSRPELQGPWSDIYSLAATIYRMLTDKMPADATERMLQDDLEPTVHIVGANYRPRFLAAIDWGLRLKTQDRPKTVAEWRTELLRTDQPDGVRSSPVARPAAPGYVPAPVSVAPRSEAARAPLTAGGRPDMSWLDEVETPEETPKPQSVMENPGVLQGWYGVLGFIGGAIAGALSSVVLASILSSGCSNDSCVGMFLPVSTVIGALAGVAIGVHLARARMRGDTPADFGPLDRHS